MTLGDRRLLIELGAVLVIKLAILFLLKLHFFSPTEREVTGAAGSGEQSRVADAKPTSSADEER